MPLLFGLLATRCALCFESIPSATYFLFLHPFATNQILTLG